MLVIVHVLYGAAHSISAMLTTGGRHSLCTLWSGVNTELEGGETTLSKEF